MKRQNGFISSSSSVTITYSHGVRGPATWSKTSWTNLRTDISNVDIYDGRSYSIIDPMEVSTSTTVDMRWKTFQSSAYQRIEMFMEAVEKLNAPYVKTRMTEIPLSYWCKSVAMMGMYNGFVDIVITYPVEVRLAGLELFNPWINKLVAGQKSDDWKYLPSKFSIYKVEHTKSNDDGEKLTYEADIAKNNGKERPIIYDKINYDPNLILLGTYDVNWENVESYKCFFKYNAADPASIAMNESQGSLGTATWKCKQLVLRIFDTPKTPKFNSSDEVKDECYRYIRDTENALGTTYGQTRRELTTEDAKLLFGRKMLKSSNNYYWAYPDNSDKQIYLFNYKKTSPLRSYCKVSDFKIETGIRYKLGGVQPLLSPDIFSVAEMKMYKYNSDSNSKVFIGEWNKDLQRLQFYGTGVVKTSPAISLNGVERDSIVWKHNFNVPPKYLDAQVFLKFNMDYGDFYVGDVVTNLVNMNKEPLTIRLTGSDVQISAANGICFTNPSTGEFMTFMNGVSVQMAKPGKYELYNIAKSVQANIIDYGSTVQSITKGGFPFDIYFIVKRLF